MRPAMENSALPCVARCCTATWRAATPATGSSATQTPSASSPRRRSSCRRCCRCSPASSDATLTRSHRRRTGARYVPAMRRPPRILMALALALALSPGLSLLDGPAIAAGATPAKPGRGGRVKPTHHAPPPPEVSLAPAGSGAPGVAITMAPVGLSLEYPTMVQDLGTEACPPAALVAQLRLLGSPPISLAGASQDVTAPSGALAQPSASWEAATLYSLPADFWTQLHCLLSQAEDPLTVGLNLKTGQLSWAQQMVADAQGAATNGVSFSLGNEPDLYYLPDYASLDKPQPEEEALAVSLYLQLATYLQQALAGAPLIGPELALPELPHVLETMHEQTVGVHMYPLSACGSPKAVTIRGLLSSLAANAPRRLAWVVADANAAGVPAIISEANSASCGGVAGVSDSPAAAVWAVRFVLSALDTGFREVRFHFSANTEAAGSALVILDNQSAKAAPVLLTDAQSVHVQSLSAARAGLQEEQLSSPHGRIKLVLPANSVVAVSP